MERPNDSSVISDIVAEKIWYKAGHKQYCLFLKMIKASAPKSVRIWTVNLISIDDINANAFLYFLKQIQTYCC